MRRQFLTLACPVQPLSRSSRAAAGRTAPAAGRPPLRQLRRTCCCGLLPLVRATHPCTSAPHARRAGCSMAAFCSECNHDLHLPSKFHAHSRSVQKGSPHPSATQSNCPCVDSFLLELTPEARARREQEKVAVRTSAQRTDPVLVRRKPPERWLSSTRRQPQRARNAPTARTT